MNQRFGVANRYPSGLGRLAFTALVGSKFCRVDFAVLAGVNVSKGGCMGNIAHLPTLGSTFGNALGTAFAQFFLTDETILISIEIGKTGHLVANCIATTAITPRSKFRCIDTSVCIGINVVKRRLVHPLNGSRFCLYAGSQQ